MPILCFADNARIWCWELFFMSILDPIMNDLSFFNVAKIMLCVIS